MAEQDNGKPPHVLADPHAELPVKNYKYVKNCVELYLSQRGIDALAHFEGFVNLEVLWLNHNRIDTLEHLDQCVRIKELYAQGNRIRSLEGSSLGHFKFLRTLRLNDNKLRDFASTLAVLAKLRHLEDLDLYGNAVQEEDNYRLHVVRTVPSLLVLDRHVVTVDERANAARLRGDEPLVARASDRKTKRQQRDAAQHSMSGTVRMLFKEVETIEREREAARKEALAQELRRMAQQQQQLTRPSSQGTSRAGGDETSFTGVGLDTWELAALEKRFRSLEDKPKGGLPLDRLPVLVAYLADRGFAVTCNGASLMQDDAGEPSTQHAAVDTLSKVFPDTAAVAWPQFQQSLAKRQLQCQLLSSAQLTRRADAYFTQAAARQKRLNGASGDDDAVRTVLLRESLDAAQRGYHLAALADDSKRVDAREREPPAKRPGKQHVLSPLKTRYAVTTFAREETETPAFHALDDQRARVSGALSTKYKFHHKDFQKYMVKQAPPTTTLVRRHFHL